MIATKEDLERAIQDLETKQANELLLLRTQYQKTFEGLKPMNLIKGSFKDIVTAPDLKKTVVNAAIGLTTGFITKKLLIGKTSNPLKKILGFIVELVVAKKVVEQVDEIRSSGGSSTGEAVLQRPDPEKV